jgi:hypothetical protein
MVSQNLGNFHNNNDKVVVKVTKELEHYKQVFFGLIDKAQGKLNQLEAERKVAPNFRILIFNESQSHFGICGNQ